LLCWSLCNTLLSRGSLVERGNCHGHHGGVYLPVEKKGAFRRRTQIWGVHDQNAGPANLGRLYRFAPSGSEGSCT
jgi:hypothetical protein